MTPRALPTREEFRARARRRRLAKQAAKPAPEPWPPPALGLPSDDALEQASRPDVLMVPMGGQLVPLALHFQQEPLL